MFSRPDESRRLGTRRAIEKGARVRQLAKVASGLLELAARSALARRHSIRPPPTAEHAICRTPSRPPNRSRAKSRRRLQSHGQVRQVYLAKPLGLGCEKERRVFLHTVVVRLFGEINLRNARAKYATSRSRAADSPPVSRACGTARAEQTVAPI